MTWNPDPSSGSIVYQTKDIDFGEPAVRKKVYRVRISYKGDAGSLVVKYSTNGDTNTYKYFEGTDSTTGKPDGSEDLQPLFNKTDLTVWHHAELKPSVSSESNNVYSFQFVIAGATGAGAGPEITRVKCVADVGDSLAGKYFIIYGNTGKTLVWLDVDNDNSPSKPSGLSEALVLEVQGIATNDPVEKVAIEIANTVGDHAEFLTEVQGDTVIITDAASGVRTNAFDGDTGFQIITDSEGGTGSAPATFEINDISIVYRTKGIK